MSSLSISPSPVSSINRTVNTVRSSIFSHNTTTASSVLHLGTQHTPAASSIYRVGTNQVTPTSSFFHPGVSVNSSEDIENDAIRDRIRYQYAQKRMREKRAEEEAQSDLGISVGTGGSFRSKKFHKGLLHMKYSRPDKYKNLSIDDLKYFEGLVEGHARSLKVGGGFSKNTKLRMKRQVWKDRRAGLVKSRSDQKDMENLINDLPG
ncbi:MAG TPA: hypothetical protein PK295_02920 [Candidatus Magasanikbacteria bacterium]|nr:hypothetical protein [Candidatus Magasanikbacteria bacterium]